MAARAFGMISGGLDSFLAVAVLRRQGLEITGLHFFNGFNSGTMRRTVLEGLSMAEQAEAARRRLEGALAVPVRVIDVSEEFLEVLAAPAHGFGRNANPCIDCRIFLLGKARVLMERERYDFVFTGEVLGQRPMSQHRQAMTLVERESGLTGRLLRPLCARLLPETIPEREGLVDRTQLFDIQGRSRRRQMELALELGLSGYEQPAGGCALTDENFARRLRDLAAHGGALDGAHGVLLSVGRHLRLGGGLKLVVGRHRVENEYIERDWAHGTLLTTVDHPGPTALLIGEPDGGELAAAAAVTARYSDGKGEPSVRVSVASGGKLRIVEVAPAADEDIARWRV